MTIYIGTAGWSIPKQSALRFPEEGSHLQRYSQVFNAVEINSTFYKEHKRETFEKWAASVPEDFRFSSKLSRLFTHDTSSEFSASALKTSLEGMSGLGEKWRVLLLQFPGSLRCPLGKLARLLEEIRRTFGGVIALEARNTSWVSPEAVEILRTFDVTRVSADPERCPWEEKLGPIDYERLHGAPEIYKSSYPEEVIEILSETLGPREHWIIFDNTTFGHATDNALELKKRARLDLEDLT